ncbi:hypothetical protein [Rhizobium tumorigenes]|uniref:hypothetical protein n=1 Tax=Rhizobium tumorigenes TaxID=2041385 RepID=UPI00241D359B|nr:hypothetical protein [Rhizobium tumorigenes]WFS02673.1 hypothetical protein PR016_08765 [Rhizobium tumorigenes]
MKSNAAVSAEYHLTNITRILFIALLIAIKEKIIDSEKFNSFEKKLIVNLARELFGGITSEKFKESLDSVKSFGDKASDIWRTYGSSVISIFNAIAAKYEIGKIEVDAKDTVKID